MLNIIILHTHITRAHEHVKLPGNWIAEKAFSSSHLSSSLSGWSCRGFSSAQTPWWGLQCQPPGGFCSPSQSQRRWGSRAAAPRSPGCASARCPARSQTPPCRQAQWGCGHLQKHHQLFKALFIINPWHIPFISVFQTKGHVSFMSRKLFRKMICASLTPPQYHCNWTKSKTQQRQTWVMWFLYFSQICSYVPSINICNDLIFLLYQQNALTVSNCPVYFLIIPQAKVLVILFWMSMFSSSMLRRLKTI